MLAILKATFLAALLLLSLPARAELRLLDEPLRLRIAPPAGSLRVLALAADDAAKPPMDFDLLGEPEPAPASSAREVRRARRREWMMQTHQAVGLGLVALQLATTTVGQLNYSDKFADGPNTNRWRELHAALAWTNLGVFALNGGIALLAPSPPGRKDAGFDRIQLHKLSMLTAAVGMAAQGVLGLYTANREGFQNQERIGTVHLAIGYATFTALMVGFSAIVL